MDTYNWCALKILWLPFPFPPSVGKYTLCLIHCCVAEREREKRKQTQEAVIYWIPSIMKSGGYWSLHKDRRREMVGRNRLYLLKCKYGKDWEELGLLLWPMNWHQNGNLLERIKWNARFSAMTNEEKQEMRKNLDQIFVLGTV